MAIANNKNNTAITSKQNTRELSIQISLSGLSFCILNRETNSISGLKSIQFKKQLNPIEVLKQLEQCFLDEDLLQSDFNAVNVIHDNELSTLVPESLFDENSIADYLKFNSKILKSDFVTFDTIEINKSVNVYIPYVNVNNYIFDRYGDFTYKHSSTVLIETFLQADKNSEDTQFYVHVNHNRFQIVVVSNRELLFYNSFEYATKEDFIYYILFTAEQLKYNPETLNLILLGNISKTDELYNIAYKYIRNVSFIDQKNNYTFNDDNTNVHSNFILTNSF